MTLIDQELTLTYYNWKFIVTTIDVTAFADDTLRWQHEVALPLGFNYYDAVWAILDVAPHEQFKHDRQELIDSLGDNDGSELERLRLRDHQWQEECDALAEEPWQDYSTETPDTGRYWVYLGKNEKPQVIRADFDADAGAAWTTGNPHRDRLMLPGLTHFKPYRTPRPPLAHQGVTP